MVNIAICGAAGRMGRTLIRCVTEADDLELAAALEQPGHAVLGQDAGAQAGVPEAGVTVSDDPAVVGIADVLIDFTFHTAAPANAAAAVAGGAALVMGTTGLTDEEQESLVDASAKVPVVRAPNMSLGMNVLFSVVERAARALGNDYDAEIVETHHRHKKDAPSGTALHLGRCVAEGREQDFDAQTVYGRKGILGERPAGQIGIHAVRAGDTVGDHTVILAAESERLELAHRATSRDTFALGALRAARWVAGRNAGLYDMQDVLGLRRPNADCRL